MPPKAATDPTNWIRDPAGSDPDPDPLTNGTFFHQPKNTQNAKFVVLFLSKFFKHDRFFHKKFQNSF